MDKRDPLIETPTPLSPEPAQAEHRAAPRRGVQPKNLLRVALPLLATWADSLPLPYVWIDRQGRVARGGELSAAELAAAFPHVRTQIVLHPDDVIVTAVNVPAVPGNRYDAAVRSTLEGLVLGDLDTLAIGYSPRAKDGTAVVAWTARDALRNAWQRLSAVGLLVHGFYPLQIWSDLTTPNQPEPLQHSGDPRWRAAAPVWSLTVPQLAPRLRSRWRGTIAWLSGAAAIWIVGLNLYAAQLHGEAQQLRQRMEDDVRDAFPELPVILDPLRQAQQGRDALQAVQGGSSGKDLLSLARAAAQVLPFSADAVDRMTYQNDVMSLTLNQSESGASLTPSLGVAPPSTNGNQAKADDAMAATASILQRASSLGVRVERDDQGAWRITRAEP